MKATNFIWEDLIQEGFGLDHNRITKIVSSLRSVNPSLFPVSTKGADKAEKHVNVLHAANLIYILSVNPNPVNKVEFADRVSQIFLLKSGSKFFINQLAEILKEGGLSLDSQVISEILISIDRPYCEIRFKEGKVIKFSSGNIEDQFGAQRVVILSVDFLHRLSVLVSRTNSHDATWGDPSPEFIKERNQLVEYIQSYKPIGK